MAMTAEHGDVELVVDATVAAGAAALGVLLRSVRRVAAVGEPVVGALLRPPLVPERYAPAALLTPLATQGRSEREAMETAAAEAVRVAVPLVLETVLDQVDLTKLVIDRVDVDAVVAHADVDAVVARADLDAILARIDLIELAETIIDGVDLPGIIRDSTGSIASEGIRGVRMQTIDADERVNRLVDRVLLRRQARTTEAPVPAQRDGSDGNGSGEQP
jgi:hypothetical protein